MTKFVKESGSTWERVLLREPIDVTAAMVTSTGARYSFASCGWMPGAFSRVPIPFNTGNRLDGRRSGWLVVLGSIDGKRNGWSLVCKCSCGNYVLARPRHIRHQSVRMCGECDFVTKHCDASRPARKTGKVY